MITEPLTKSPRLMDQPQDPTILKMLSGRPNGLIENLQSTNKKSLALLKNSTSFTNMPPESAHISK